MSLFHVLAAAAAGYLGYKVFLDKKETPVANPDLGQVSELEQGKSYTVIHATNKGLRQAATAMGMSAQELIRRTMESAGFEFLSNPNFKDAEAAARYAQDADTAWVYNVKRTTPEKYISTAPPTWSGMMQFYKLPAT